MHIFSLKICIYTYAPTYICMCICPSFFCSVLLFPPVNNFRRFLIHQTCEQFRQQYDLFTFSVGQGLHRRTVVCFRNQLLDPNKFTDTAAAANFESRKKSPVKSWRSERKPEGTINDITSTIARQQKNTISKMGVEKNGGEIRIAKTNSIDLYRPPALRNYNLSADAVDASTATCEKSGSVNAPTTALAAEGSSCAATAIGKATLISTSISCNNSPTHVNEDNHSFDNNTVTSRCVNDSDGVITPTVTTKTTIPTTTALVNHSESSGSDMAPTANVAGVTNSNGQQRQPSAVRRERRPDRAVYIPRARRSQTTPPKTPAPTFGEVKEIQQQHHHQRHEQANAITSTTDSLAPMPSTTVYNNSSSGCSGGSDGGSSQQQQLAITSETRASVYTAASTKLDDISANKSVGTVIANSVGKKSKSTAVASRERRERSKKSITTVEGQEAKISKLSLDRKETKLQQKQQQQDYHESGALGDTLIQKTNLVTQTQQQQEYQQRSLSTFFGQQESIGRRVQEIQTEIIINNEMNSKSGKRTKVKQHNSGNVGSTNKVHNLRIEDVASAENGTISRATKCDIEVQEFQRASKEINRSNRRIIKQTFVSDVLEIPEKIENATENDTINQKSPNNILQLPVAQTNRSAVDSTTEEEEEDDWETMYDDSGECLDPKIVQELTASVGKVKIELPKMDYSAYLTKQSILNDEEFPHVLEVSNFPMEFKNHDLLMVFSQYKESGFDIKWVDDTHALAVFSSSQIAAEVLTMGHPFVVLKPLAEATVESRLKAKKCAASLQPYRQRPETCAALARRLVTGALGVRLKTAAAERENEKRVLREAKERKLLAAKQRDETWES